MIIFILAAVIFQLLPFNGYPSSPASDNVIANYAAYLARRLSPRSIPQNLNVVRLLHVEAKVVNPCQSWAVKSTVRGIERLLGNPANRKTPVLPPLLLDMYSSLYLLDPLDAMFWAASLVLFFGTFRKSNLFPDNAAPSDKHSNVRILCYYLMAL